MFKYLVFFSSNIVYYLIHLDFLEQNTENDYYSVAVTSKVRIELKCGSFHEDIGFGLSENLKSKGHSLARAKKVIN